MDYAKILEKFLEYAEYDENQTSFNILSSNYIFHKVCNLLKIIIEKYDNTGLLAVIYAKIQFENMMKDTNISLWDAIHNKQKFEKEKEMALLFSSSDIVKAENELYSKVNYIFGQISQGKLLQDPEEDKSQLYNNIEMVIECIDRLNIDLFAKGGTIGMINNINPTLLIFTSLSECLLHIEHSPDGLYFCFIQANNSPECFFSYFIKSNGTILSINDRVNEPYIGSHQGHRNAGWTEDKSPIFPYNFIIDFSKYDYKGYSNHYSLDTNAVNLLNLNTSAYIPIILSILMLILRYSNKDIDLPLHYIDTFVSFNQEDTKELLPITGSSIVEKHNLLNLSFDKNKILSGEYAKEFHYDANKDNKVSSEDLGCFNGNNQLLVDIWGNDFVYNPDNLFHRSMIKQLTSGDSVTDEYIPEFVGSEQKMRLQAYKEVREQLAEQIEMKMLNEWYNFGGTTAIIEWYKSALSNNIQAIYKLLADYENGETYTFFVSKTTDIYQPSKHLVVNAENELNAMDCTSYKCNETNSRCNLWFTIQPNTWEDIEYLTQCEVPKIVKGWRRLPLHSGNPILSVTDKVDRISFPFERDFIVYKGQKIFNTRFDFTITFGFSKRGWNKIKKSIK